MRRHLRAALHFGTATFSVLAVIVGLLTIAEPGGLRLAALGALAMEVFLPALGYVVTLAQLPLRDASRLTTRAHAVAGALVPVVLGVLSVFTQGASPVGIAALSTATGVVIALAHWVRARRPPRPPTRSLEEREAEADAALQRALSGQPPVADVIPIRRPDRIDGQPQGRRAS